MNRIWVFILLGLVLSLPVSGCVKNNSSIDQLTVGDPVKKLQIPKSKKRSKNRFISEKNNEGYRSKASNKGMGLGKLKKLKSPFHRKLAVVTGNNVPLRKGPGIKFRKIGTADKGDEFTFFREVRRSAKTPIWYLVANDEGQKFFIPKLFAKLESKTIEAQDGSNGKGLPGRRQGKNGSTGNPAESGKRPL